MWVFMEDQVKERQQALLAEARRANGPALEGEQTRRRRRRRRRDRSPERECQELPGAARVIAP